MGKPANPKKITIKIDLCEKENAAFNLSFKSTTRENYFSETHPHLFPRT